MHDVLTVPWKVCLNTLAFSMSGAALLSTSAAESQVATSPPEASWKQELASLPALSGEWTVVNGEKGTASVRDGFSELRPFHIAICFMLLAAASML
jgi:hypothetical protein